MPASDADGAKSFAALLQRPSIADQFAIPYPLGRAPSPPGTNEDPGRIRNENFFIKMYGDCRRGAVAPALVSTRWVAGTTLSATRINGVAGRLAAVARALEALPGDLAKFLAPPAGAYHCRAIAGTGRLSAHAFGAAIDVNARYGDYWRWSMAAGAAPAWKNRVPAQIVEMFERHGFIWGGRWYHYDTFHFEYRPELVALAKRVATQP
ncbi:MAG: M15 family metallopeptidase [Proteobacteria bacterium]|nr:M15 family metallopeptidase [Pseudomonadota bacterium]